MTLSSDLLAKVQQFEWYHTLELAPGVVTPGWFDTRELPPRLPFPNSLKGKRCLDIGTFDGFWAFEMERRGAAEVVAIDLLNIEEIDWPPNTQPQTVDALRRRKRDGQGFELAKECLRSSVIRHDLSVYDLDEQKLGQFDFVYFGSLLLHLRDPVRALESVRRVSRGEVLIVDTIDLLLTILFPHRPTASIDVRGRPWWWICNSAGIVRLVEAALFRVAEHPRRIFIPPGTGQPLRPLRPQMVFTRSGRDGLLKRLLGDAHVVIRAVPTNG